MGRSINLLRNYPKSKRNLDKRLEEKNHTVRAIARKFGKDFFDGDRKYGYGGFNYHERFWKKDCAKSIKEINRVCKRKSFITVDAYRNKSEKEKMFKWNLTAKTIMSVKQWKVFFKKNSYKGDYYWFIP